MIIRILTLVVILTFLFVTNTFASTPNNIEQCLKRTDEAPDIAAAESDAWFKNGGGFSAKLCHAFSQFKRQDFLSAAREFKILAASIEVKDTKQSAFLHTQAGLSFMRAQESKDAEREYAVALKLNPEDPDIWLDRSIERAAAEHYWDAVSDATQAIKLSPKNPVALRLRGQAWIKLGNDQKAEDDFVAAEDIDPSPLPIEKR